MSHLRSRSPGPEPRSPMDFKVLPEKCPVAWIKKLMEQTRFMLTAIRQLVLMFKKTIVLNKNRSAELKALIASPAMTQATKTCLGSSNLLKNATTSLLTLNTLQADMHARWAQEVIDPLIEFADKSEEVLQATEKNLRNELKKQADRTKKLNTQRNKCLANWRALDDVNNLDTSSNYGNFFGMMKGTSMYIYIYIYIYLSIVLG